MQQYKQQPSVTAASVTRSMRVRAIVMAAVLGAVGFIAVICSLVYFQLLDPGDYKSRAAAQQLDDNIIKPERGVIYDANMKVLAQSMTVWTVVASPASMAQAGTDVTLVAAKLAEILELDIADVMEKLLRTTSGYQAIKKKVEKPQADAITQWISDYNAQVAEHNKTAETSLAYIRGITLEADTTRVYPYSTLASSVLGFTNVDGDGLAGLELSYNSTLTGTPGRTLTYKNAYGYEMDGDYRAVYEPVNGYSIVSTIDTTIQQSLEKYLSNAIVEHNVANRGMGIVMNVKTGAILAMATMPDYDCNNPYTLYDTELAAQIAAIADETERTSERQKAQQLMWRNKAVQDIYEPGSVFKVVTASAALDSGKANMNTSFSCSGRLHIVGPVYMRCAHEEGHGGLDFYGGLNNSCNPYFIQLGWQMGKETFCDYLSAFGFYERTGIDLPNEAQSNVYTVDKMNITELSSSSFGQSSQVTALQMITSMATAVNGGKLLRPYLVQQVLDANGNIIQNTEPTVKRQVISEETSATIASLLERSVAEGQNKHAYVKGYRVGGKSGTSQKQTIKEGNEEDTLRISSFCGFAPANDPEVAVIIVLDEPHDQFRSFGGRLCAPVVASILSETLPYLGIEPQYTEEELATQETVVPNMAELSLSDAHVQLNKVGFNYRDLGSGQTVTYQYPAAGTTLARQSTIILYTDEGAEGTIVTVPDISGKSISVARSTMQSLGLNIVIEGVAEDATNVEAVAQSVEAGTETPMGTVVTVTFHDTSIQD